MGIHFQVLSDEDLERIHWGTLHILEKIGVQVDSPTCRKLLKDNGCEVDEKTRIAKIPSHLVEEALSKKKTSITLAGRNPKYDAKLDMNHSYMTANGNGAVAVDFETGTRRPSTKQDLVKSSRIIDALQNVHIHWPMVSSTDQQGSVVHLHDLDASLNNTEKHVMYETAVTISDAKGLVEMGYIAAGGEKEYRRRPLTSCLQCTYAPLQHDAGVMDASLELAKSGVPLVFFGMPQPGATGPATLVGSLVVGNAEVLSALTMTQLAIPGASVIYGMGNAPLDMRTTIRAGGSPEHALSSAMATELAHYYGMPSCVGVSATAKEPGDQAVLEYYTGCVGPLLAGADLMCGIGLLEDSSCLFLEQIVIDDEIVGAICPADQGRVGGRRHDGDRRHREGRPGEGLPRAEAHPAAHEERVLHAQPDRQALVRRVVPGRLEVAQGEGEGQGQDDTRDPQGTGSREGRPEEAGRRDREVQEADVGRGVQDPLRENSNWPDAWTASVPS